MHSRQPEQRRGAGITRFPGSTKQRLVVSGHGSGLCETQEICQSLPGPLGEIRSLSTAAALCSEETGTVTSGARPSAAIPHPAGSPLARSEELDLPLWSGKTTSEELEIVL